MSDLVNSNSKPKRLPLSQWPLRRSIELQPSSDDAYERKFQTISTTASTTTLWSAATSTAEDVPNCSTVTPPQL